MSVESPNKTAHLWVFYCRNKKKDKQKRLPWQEAVFNVVDKLGRLSPTGRRFGPNADRTWGTNHKKPLLCPNAGKQEGIGPFHPSRGQIREINYPPALASNHKLVFEQTSISEENVKLTVNGLSK